MSNNLDLDLLFQAKAPKYDQVSASLMGGWYLLVIFTLKIKHPKQNPHFSSVCLQTHSSPVLLSSLISFPLIEISVWQLRADVVPKTAGG